MSYIHAISYLEELLKIHTHRYSQKYYKYIKTEFQKKLSNPQVSKKNKKREIKNIEKTQRKLKGRLILEHISNCNKCK